MGQRPMAHTHVQEAPGWKARRGQGRATGIIRSLLGEVALEEWQEGPRGWAGAPGTSAARGQPQQRPRPLCTPCATSFPSAARTT